MFPVARIFHIHDRFLIKSWKLLTLHAPGAYKLCTNAILRFQARAHSLARIGCLGDGDQKRKEIKMPKMKTHSGAKKRFSVTRRGKVQARPAHKRHLMTNKSKRMRVEGRSTLIMNESDAKILLDNFLPYQRKLTRKKRRYEGKKNKEAA
jgi:large subunit ribosomal protein L35